MKKTTNDVLNILPLIHLEVLAMSATRCQGLPAGLLVPFQSRRRGRRMLWFSGDLADSGGSGETVPKLQSEGPMKW